MNKNACACAAPKAPLSFPGFEPVYEIPYLMGVDLALNAVSDAGMIVDGPACSVMKADFIEGNHDLYSNLLSEAGEHRIMCTGRPPVNPDRNPEKQIAGIVESAAGCGHYSVLLLSALPFLKITGLDHEGLVGGIKHGIPIEVIPANSLTGDWLDGYGEFLDAMARALPAGKRRPAKKKRSAAVIGYMMDRREADHVANLAELKRLLGFAGIELLSVWPSGGTFAELARAAGAELLISLPYGRKAARTLAKKYGSKVVETGLPLGLSGTRAWLSAVCRAAGLAARLPESYLAEERRAAAAVSPAFSVLAHKRALFCGDPYLYAAFAAFAAELCMRPSLALLNAAPRELELPEKPEVMLFRPLHSEARRTLRELGARARPDLAVLNSFAISGALAGETPFIELGFPSFGHHCLAPEPFLGLAGARFLVSRLFNCVVERRSSERREY